MSEPIDNEGVYKPIEPEVIQEQHSEDKKELVKTHATAILDDRELVERRANALICLKEAGLRMLNTRHVVDVEGNPLITSNGCESFARLAGIRWGFEHKVNWHEDELGPYYIVEVYGWAEFANERIPVFGSCSSRDKFFGKAHGQYKALKDIDMQNIIKKAHANFKRRAIEDFGFGITDLSWEELTSVNPKLTKENCVSIKFNKTDNNLKTVDSSTQETLEDLRIFIRDILMKIHGGDANSAQAHLEQVSAFEGKDGLVPGFKSVQQIKNPKRAGIIYGKLKQAYKQSFSEEYSKPVKE